MAIRPFSALYERTGLKIVMNKNFDIKIFKSFEDPLKNIWKEFEKESSNYCFQNFYWVKNWYEKFKSQEEIDACIVVIYSDKIICGVLPFCIHKKSSLKFLKWMGGEQSDYMNGLFSKNFILKQDEFVNLWKLIKKQLPSFDLVYFYNQPENIMGSSNPFVKNLKAVRNSFTDGIKVENSFEEYLNLNIKKKFLNDTKRSFNQLNKRGQLEFKIHNKSDILNKSDFVQKILDDKVLRLKELNIKNSFTKNIQEFYTKFNSEEFENGELHVSSLELDGKTLASHWGVVYKNIFYYLLPSIVKNELMRYSPGRLLLYHLIKWSFENKIKRFDLTLGEESYKKEWSNSKVFLYDFVEPNKLKSYPHFFYLKVRIQLKKFLKKIYNYG